MSSPTLPVQEAAAVLGTPAAGGAPQRAALLAQTHTWTPRIYSSCFRLLR